MGQFFKWRITPSLVAEEAAQALIFVRLVLRAKDVQILGGLEGEPEREAA